MLQEKDVVLRVILETMIDHLQPFLDPHTGVIDCTREIKLIKSGRMSWLAHDIVYVLRCHPEHVLLALPPLIQLLSRMQGMNSHRRALLAHVEFEDEGWITALTLLLNLGDTLELLLHSFIKSVWRDKKKKR